MQMKLVDTSGKSKGKITLPDEIFACKPNQVLLSQAVRVYLANQRQKTVKVKTRGEVRGSTRKIWRQKGTGRARHGDRYAPIFVGGGIAHGPTGKENVKLKLSKKMRRKALFSALSLKVKENQLLVVDGLEKLEPKTKIVNNSLRSLTQQEKDKIKKTTIITSGNASSLQRGARNIKSVKLLSAEKLNTYEIINSGFLLVMKDAIKKIKETFLAKKAKEPRIVEKQSKKRVEEKKINKKKTRLEKEKQSRKVKII